MNNRANGGGLASANALKTGLPAYTYNAAALHPDTKEYYGLNKDANIQAYIVQGEILNILNRAMGLRAEGNINTIHIPNEMLRNIAGAISPFIGASDAVLRHVMGSVLKALDCDD